MNANTSQPIDPCSYLSQPLPSDLYTPEGGSAPFGGPQDPVDGHVRIFGDNFILRTTPSRDNFVLFRVLTPSFLRVFAKASLGDDLDFFIYSNVSRPPGSLVPGGSSVGTDIQESKLVSLPTRNKTLGIHRQLEEPFGKHTHSKGKGPAEESMKPICSLGCRFQPKNPQERDFLEVC